MNAQYPPARMGLTAQQDRRPVLNEGSRWAPVTALTTRLIKSTTGIRPGRSAEVRHRMEATRQTMGRTWVAARWLPPGQCAQ
jgi:hypothetical protein